MTSRKSATFIMAAPTAASPAFASPAWPGGQRLLVVVAVLVRWLVALHPHSGMRGWVSGWAG
jgi:hypothetical protein